MHENLLIVSVSAQFLKRSLILLEVEVNVELLLRCFVEQEEPTLKVMSIE